MKLSPREITVVRCLCDGQTIRETAVTLGISHKTVEGIVTHIYHKAAVRNRFGFFIWCSRNGFIGTDQEGGVATGRYGVSSATLRNPVQETSS